MYNNKKVLVPRWLIILSSPNLVAGFVSLLHKYSFGGKKERKKEEEGIQIQNADCDPFFILITVKE